MPKKKKDNRFLISILFMLAFLSLSILSFTLYLYSEIMPTYSREAPINISIYFDGLTEQQILNSEAVISHVKAVYLIPQTSITITNNMSKYYPDANGVNSRKGNITLGYFHCYLGVDECLEDEYYFRVTLAHELLHTFISSPVDSNPPSLEEEIIQDISEQLVCYDDVTKKNSFPETWKSTL